MVGANHAGYTDRFHELAKLVPHLVTPESSRIKRYIDGLAPEIRGILQATQPTIIQSAILRAGILTDESVSCGEDCWDIKFKMILRVTTAQVRILQKSQENGQNWTITDTGKEKRIQERERGAEDMLIKSLTSPSALIGQSPQGECHADARKHTKMQDFTLNPSLKKHNGSDTRNATLAIRVLTKVIQRLIIAYNGRAYGTSLAYPCDKLELLKALLSTIAFV
ncbi:hypothetical protein Tco_0938302 [Tanacetum coccineum]|uniref:Reverse transcriptase domain-containing protein n=1 Tax=Tanacetum coccineum TaxID=301880 RepID=A0ABQ5DHN2_9ASTR